MDPSDIDWSSLSCDLWLAQIASEGLDFLMDIFIYSNMPANPQDYKVLFSALSTLFSLKSLSVIFDSLFFFLKISAILFIFYFCYILILKISKEEGIVIMPFEIPTGESVGKYNGKAISDLMTYELLRIKRINDEYDKTPEEYPAESENLRRQMIGTQSESPEYREKGTGGAGTRMISGKIDIPKIPIIIPESESLDYVMADVGTIGTGSFSLSLGGMIVAFKRLCPGFGPIPIITGSICNYGKTIIIVARLEDREIRAWEVRRRVTKGNSTPEEHIPSMIRDLSFKIALYLYNMGLKS